MLRGGPCGQVGHIPPWEDSSAPFLTGIRDAPEVVPAQLSLNHKQVGQIPPWEYSSAPFLTGIRDAPEVVPAKREK